MSTCRMLVVYAYCWPHQDVQAWSRRLQASCFAWVCFNPFPHTPSIARDACGVRYAWEAGYYHHLANTPPMEVFTSDGQSGLGRGAAPDPRSALL